MERGWGRPGPHRKKNPALVAMVRAYDPSLYSALNIRERDIEIIEILVDR